MQVVAAFGTDPISTTAGQLNDRCKALVAEQKERPGLPVLESFGFFASAVFGANSRDSEGHASLECT